MSAVTHTAVSPWQDQWSTPSIDQLVADLQDQHRKVFSNLLDKLEPFDNVQRSLAWHGSGWHWVIQYDLTDPQDNPLETLCFIITSPQSPFVCVPLTRDTYQRLPIRRLPKLVRTAVRAAKCSVNTHWTTVNLSFNAELDQLMDLIKRKHRYAMEPFKVTKASKNGGKRK